MPFTHQGKTYDDATLAQAITALDNADKANAAHTKRSQELAAERKQYQGMMDQMSDFMQGFKGQQQQAPHAQAQEFPFDEDMRPVADVVKQVVGQMLQPLSQKMESIDGFIGQQRAEQERAAQQESMKSWLNNLRDTAREAGVDAIDLLQAANTRDEYLEPEELQAMAVELKAQAPAESASPENQNGQEQQQEREYPQWGDGDPPADPSLGGTPALDDPGFADFVQAQLSGANVEP